MRTELRRTGVAVTVLLVLGLASASVELCVLGAGLAGLLGIAWILGSAAVFWWLLRRRDWHALGLHALACCAVVLGHFASLRVRSIWDRHAMERGDLVLAALHEYRDAYGRFPERLDALVPHFLSDLPRPRNALFDFHGFSYSDSHDGSEFWFGFDTHAFLVWVRTDTEDWRLMD